MKRDSGSDPLCGGGASGNEYDEGDRVTVEHMSKRYEPRIEHSEPHQVSCHVVVGKSEPCVA